MQSHTTQLIARSRARAFHQRDTWFSVSATRDFIALLDALNQARCNRGVHSLSILAITGYDERVTKSGQI